MKKLAIFAGAGLMAFGIIGSASAQPSPFPILRALSFPDAAPHEIRSFNGVPCRTILDPTPGIRAFLLRVPARSAGS